MSDPIDVPTKAGAVLSHGGFTYLLTPRLRYRHTTAFSGAPPVLEQCWRCVESGPDLWLPVASVTLPDSGTTTPAA